MASRFLPSVVLQLALLAAAGCGSDDDTICIRTGYLNAYVIQGGKPVDPGHASFNYVVSLGGEILEGSAGGFIELDGWTKNVQFTLEREICYRGVAPALESLQIAYKGESAEGTILNFRRTGAVVEVGAAFDLDNPPPDQFPVHLALLVHDRIRPRLPSGVGVTDRRLKESSPPGATEREGSAPHSSAAI